MIFARQEILSSIKIWLQAWDQHNLNGVMALMHDDVIFENWTGQRVNGKQALQRSWTPWFLKHNDFLFIAEDIFVDEQDQKVLFQWRLEWPSQETAFKGAQEIRRGVDVLHFLDGKIHKKLTYSKTTLSISGHKVSLQAVS
jgi:hypothetical protein